MVPVSAEYPLVLVSDFGEYSGYGILASRVAEQLHQAGVPIRVRILNNYTPPKWLDKLRQWNIPHGWEMYIGPPEKIRYNPATSNIALTMWEAGRLSASWIRDLSLNTRLIILPCEWNMITFDAAGIQSEFSLIQLGYDQSIYWDKGFWPENITFGVAASTSVGGARKNIEQTIDCFRQAFPDQTDVRLKIKLTPSCKLNIPNDHRISVIQSNLAPSEMCDWYNSITAFVNTSHAEGFGMHMLEAMACGKPLISPKFGGTAEYMTDYSSYPVSYKLVPAECSHKLYRGLWCQPNSESVIESMRQVYHHKEYRNKGKLSAEVAKKFTWDIMGGKILSALAKCGAIIDPSTIRGNDLIDKPVTIVILTWNAFLITRQYIDSFIECPLPKNADWQFVDNGSTDQTLPLLLAWKMPVIKNDKNYGFTKAANQGIVACHGDIVLMNNDTIILQKDWLARLQATAYSSDDIGIVGCRIADQEGNIIHCGGEVDAKGQGRNIQCGPSECLSVIDRKYVTFACVYIKRSVVEKIGLMDEDYFAYYEDVDYCFRAREAGLRVVVDGSVVVMHKENSSTKANNTDLELIIQESYAKFTSKWEFSLNN